MEKQEEEEMNIREFEYMLRIELDFLERLMRLGAEGEVAEEIDRRIAVIKHTLGV